jgi:septum formation protein
MIVLASASPRRSELLTRIGVRFQVDPADLEEAVLPGESPEENAARLAREKAARVADRHPGKWVLSADTVVAVGAANLGKPQDRADAERMLLLLAGGTHRVITAYCLRLGLREHARSVTTEVDVAPLTEREIGAYLASGEWQGKAGAYAIQGIFAYAVRAVRGSYTNVVGLPLHEVATDLVRLGAIEELPGELSR